MNSVLLRIIFLCLISFSISAQTVIKLKSDETALIAYGSLMDKDSLEMTLGHAYHGHFIDVELSGWKRSWNVGMPNEAFYIDTPSGKIIPKNIAYLNIVPDGKTDMNAVLFVIKTSDLNHFNRREWIYDPVDLTPFIKGAKVEGGKVLGYIGKTKYLVSSTQHFPEVAIRRTYLDKVEKAIKQKGQAHFTSYQKTTSKIPFTVIDDKVDSAFDVFGYKNRQSYAFCIKKLMLSIAK